MDREEMRGGRGVRNRGEGGELEIEGRIKGTKG